MITDGSFVAFVEVRHDIDFLPKARCDEHRLKEKYSIGT